MRKGGHQHLGAHCFQRSQGTHWEPDSSAALVSACVECWARICVGAFMHVLQPLKNNNSSYDGSHRVPGSVLRFQHWREDSMHGALPAQCVHVTPLMEPSVYTSLFSWAPVSFPLHQRTCEHCSTCRSATRPTAIFTLSTTHRALLQSQA